MANTIAIHIGENRAHDIIATTLVAYALSSLLTGTCRSTLFPLLFGRTSPSGVSFLLLGLLKLGAIVGFFPRHILVGYVLMMSRGLIFLSPL